MRNLFKRILFFPFFALALSAHAELRNQDATQHAFRNYAKNGGGEQSTRGWTVSAGTLASETTTVRSGAGSISFNPSASTQTLSSSLVAIPAGNGACLAEFYYYGFGTADMRIYVKDNSGNVIGGYTAADTTWAISTAVTAWTQVQVPFACPASGTTVQLVLEAQGDAAIGYVDDYYVGRDFRVGSDNSGEIVVTATRITSVQTIASASATTVVFNSATLDKYAEFATGTGVFTAKKAGKIWASAGVNFQNHTVERNIISIRKNSTQVCYQGNQIDNSASGATTNCSFDVVVGDTIDVTVDSVADTSYDVLNDVGTYLIIERFPTASQTILRGDSSDLSGWATTAGVTSCQWSTTSASMAAFGADTDCGAPTVVGNATAPATKIPGMIVPNLIPGRYRVTAVGNFTQNTESSSGSQNCGFEIYDGATEGQKVNIFQLVSKGVGAVSVVEGEFEYTTKKTNTQFEVRAIRTTGNASCVINNDGASYADFRISILPISQAVPRAMVLGSIYYKRPYVMNGGRANLICGATSSEVSDPDNMVSATGNIATDTCTYTLTTGFFTATPLCTISEIAITSKMRALSLTLTSATSIGVQCRESSSGTVGTTLQPCNTNAQFVLDCNGN